MAKDDLLIKVIERLQEHRLLNPVTDILFLAAIVYLRNSYFGAALDFMYAPAMIVFALDLLEYIPPIQKLLLALGKRSTDMWYIHSFLCYYFYPFTRFVIATGSALISLAVLISISYLASILLGLFWSGIHRAIHSLQHYSPVPPNA